MPVVKYANSNQKSEIFSITFKVKLQRSIQITPINILNAHQAWLSLFFFGYFDDFSSHLLIRAPTTVIEKQLCWVYIRFII